MKFDDRPLTTGDPVPAKNEAPALSAAKGRRTKENGQVATLARPGFVSDGTNLRPEDVAAVARAGFDPATGAYSLPVSMSDGARERVAASRRIVDSIVERGEVVYGITTGFGAFKDRLIPQEELDQLQVNLIMSHCVGVGPALPTEVVRAMMLCRAHTLALGYSGIRPQTLGLLYDMLNAGIHPLVPEQGSVGASGDLAPLCHMAYGMIGGGRVEYRGEWMDAADALRAAGLEPARLQCKEGLALSNGTNLMSALLSLALVDAETLCDTADVVAALSLEALQGVPAAFDPRIHAARGHRGQIEVAGKVRALTAGSTLLWSDGVAGGRWPVASESAEGAGATIPTTTDGTSPPQPLATDHWPPATDRVRLGKVQDAYSLRTIPQVHGPVREAARYVRSVLEVELNGACDNPLIFGADHPDDAEGYAVLSGGNFHGAPLASAADFLSTALCPLGTISERRLARLVDVAAHGGLFPAFLIDHGGVNSGYMLVQYVAAALASENKSLAHPASVDTIPTSANTEDHVSMGPIAARHARAIVGTTAQMLALEAMAAAQAVSFRLRDEPGGRLGRGTALAYEMIREQVPFLERDRDFQPLIASATELVSSGKLAGVLRELA